MGGEKTLSVAPVCDVHGGSGLEAARRLGFGREVLDLSSNTFLACTDLTRAVISSEPYPYEQYPDPRASRLRQAVAAHEHVEPDTVLPGNGAAELIWLCFAALRPRRVVMLGPMFSEYVRACTAFGSAYTVITPAGHGFVPDADALRQLAAADADMAVLCLPNNPGASCYPQLPGLWAALGRRTILADLSYREFLHGTEAYAGAVYRELARLCVPGARLVGLHSLTKFFCCPGVRLGYALADAVTLAALAGHQPPWTVPDFAGHVGARLLGEINAFRARLPELRVWRKEMATALAASGVFTAEILAGPSFVTARLRPDLAAADVRDQLLRLGVAVRACDTIPGMPPGYLRMQVRPPEELEPLFTALRHVRGSGL